MFLSQLLQVVMGGVAATGGLSVKRGARELGWLLAACFFAGWCLMVALLALGAAAWLALAPEVGVAGATAIVGALYLVLAGLVLLAYRQRQEMKRTAQRLDAATPGPSELQQQILQSVSANIGPLLIAAVGAFLVSRLTRRD